MRTLLERKIEAQSSRSAPGERSGCAADNGDHRELALSKIDDAGRAKDQGEAQSDERVDDADAREEQLQKEIPSASALERSWLAIPAGTLRRAAVSP